MSKPPQPSAIQAVKGMNDLLPAAAASWLFLEDTTRRIFEQYGYRLMRTPIVESTPLFARSIGEVTDIVEKEMYSFEDSMNGDKLTLRPEATAGLVRAAIEHNLVYDGPKRVWTFGPMFRHERPQKGRYRQFHQFDVEAFGFSGPDVDAEQIVMLARLWKALGIANVTLHINSIGDIAARKQHRDALVAYFEAHQDQLDEDAKRRLYTNPLRTLDSKNPKMQSLVEGAPKLMQYLDEAALAHYEGLKKLLDASGVAYVENPRLVRGFDYYNRTVFEFVSKGPDWELTIGGGGRYDGLFEQLGGKSTPSCGFGIGAERVLMAVAGSADATVPADLDCYVVYAADAQLHAWRAAEAMRDAGLRVAYSGAVDGAVPSFKSQMKKADGSGARFAIILGSDEVAQSKVTLKDMKQGEQALVALDEAIARLKR
jgi:histidyl-tRNA synthetase